MIAADFRVCLDACVLANQGVCDLLLRLAENPRLYLPVFSQEILEEVRAVHLEKLPRPWPKELADHWQTEIRNAFPEAIVSNHLPLLPLLENDEDDRHVLAAAIQGRAQLIVTFNLKHFPRKALAAWDITALHPQDYLITLYEMRPDLVLSKIVAIAQKLRQAPEVRLAKLKRSIPRFAEHVAQSLGWALPDD